MPNFTPQRPKCCYSYMCEYFPASQTLVVEFTAYKKSGSQAPFTGKPYIYIYDNIPVALGESWIAGDCDGEDYNYLIRGQPTAFENYTRVR